MHAPLEAVILPWVFLKASHACIGVDDLIATVGVKHGVAVAAFPFAAVARGRVAAVAFSLYVVVAITEEDSLGVRVPTARRSLFGGGTGWPGGTLLSVGGPLCRGAVV